VNSIWREALDRLMAEEKAQRAWVNGLAAKYSIVRMPASLTDGELAEQEAMLDRMLGRKFLLTTPLPGLEMDWDGQWYRTEPI
jgi:hypothetical protein